MTKYRNNFVVSPETIQPNIDSYDTLEDDIYKSHEEKDLITDYEVLFLSPVSAIYYVKLKRDTGHISIQKHIMITQVYFRDWSKKQRFSVCDQIFLSMALTNIIIQCVMFIDALTYYIWIDLLSFKNGYVYIYIAEFFLLYGTFWHTAWLSVHYCLKLVNCSHNFFLFLKKRLSSSILQLLIMTLVGSFLINLPFIWTTHLEFLQNVTENLSSKIYIDEINSVFTLFNMVIGCCLPFIVALICIGLSVKSLLGHVWRMKQNMSQFNSSPQLKVHVRAARTMILQMLLNSIMYFAVIALCLSSFKPNYFLEAFWEPILWTIVWSYPSAQTATLILGNPKIYNRLFGHDVCS
ncbi:taste receptor type 2 member 9-like [Mixophyes fleayi]|uniref:taste receptor type 2 member 9-like n=1 Tax=Mixophyes fleayi TaxID=3061075 RepID=UPI003F4E2B8D